MANGKPGAPKGSKNHTKTTRAWSDAVRMAVARREKLKKPGALRDLADALIDKVLEGDMTAIREFGDRYEGKVPQAIEGTGEDGELSVALTIRYVDGNRSGPPEKT